MRRLQAPLAVAILVLLALVLLAASPAFAWEWAYGPPNTWDQAFRRVTPVVNCPAEGPGYIAVGTFDQFGVNPEVYVVYTPLGGGPPVWEMTYDVQAQGYEDEGMAIVEVPGGFVFLSNTRKPGTPWMPALTFIKCSGGVGWSHVYPDALAGQDLRGRDLIQTATGAFPMAPGDLAVAGWWFNGANDDTFLMRTDALGNLRWNITYDTGSFEALHALTEAGPVAANTTADLIAVGRYTTTNGDLQGLATRVNGNNGAIGLAPQCMAHHGIPNSRELYNSVTRLQAPPFVGQFAMIGTTTNNAWADDVWLTRGNPCGLAAQSRIGNPIAPAPTSEHGNDLRQILGPVIGPAGGVLGIVGDHGPAFGGPYDATYLQVVVNTLLPIGGSGRLFGDFANSNEVFYSLAEDPAGFPQAGRIFAGLTETDWQIVGDPRDMYLVHYNPLGPVGCEKNWNPQGVQLQWPQVQLQPNRRFPAKDVQVHTFEWPQWNPWQICP
jgi:hypothetical protein